MHPSTHIISIDPAVGPRVPGRARPGDSGRARSKPFTHAPEHRKALVGKAQLPQTTSTTTTTTTTECDDDDDDNDDDDDDDDDEDDDDYYYYYYDCYCYYYYYYYNDDDYDDY